ncbi:protein-glutamate methylesterase/protein-glutamine glutaminase [Methylophaga sp. OBS1]|uniref:protein-glutamate methylesterase/protein-glutamine glutaminase n=1 Tax=Methylophaga sp. OBS1 TaxID=2991933 RepID=UPI00225BBB10|nr:chemotaxis response regulator protein-glutamate methylesterase [Methylophaga sp. OBS1]MCX4193874.1 chemotaxis response regulator protein-glutamate methylesterase [Methylophaga sp. OBS1]
MKTLKVIVIDDSALIRQLLTEILNSDEAIQVVATASDPYQAREKIKLHNPDVLTLDVEMPRMDGLTFLRNLMRLRPMPVVMVSTLTEKGAEVTLEALSLGAFDFVAKPKLYLSGQLEDYAQEIISKVKAAAAMPVPVMTPRPSRTAKQKPSTPDLITTTASISSPKIIAIGASTGGTEAIKTVLCSLPPSAPAVLITQHIPAAFSAAFAKRLNGLSQLQVCQAEDGQQVLAGHVYIAPGDKHLLLHRNGKHYYCRLDDGPPVSRHKPSVDVLFHSVAEHAGPRAIGILLTGMGEDGARGMLAMKQAGAHNIVQDEKSSVVWGMPGSAFKLGAARRSLPLAEIAKEILKLSRQGNGEQG